MDPRSRRATLLIALVLLTSQCNTAPRPSPSSALPSSGSQELNSTPVRPARLSCDSFPQGSFVEAYLKFFYARREDLSPAYPDASAPDAPPNAKPATAE